MTAVIIDDEPLARMLIGEYLLSFPQIEIVAECNDGFEGLKAINQHKPGLVFLDIQMPKINGFEMLELLEQPPAVIFTTAFDEYAIKAFETHAIDYLLKPFSQERFSKAIEKYLGQVARPEAQATNLQLMQSTTHLPEQAERIVVKNGGQIKIISLAQILYLEGADDYVKIYTKEGSFLKNKTLSFYEASLPAASFVRTHRSYIVSIQEITRIDPYEKDSHLALLKSGAKIPVSRTGYIKLKTVLGL